MEKCESYLSLCLSTGKQRYSLIHKKKKKHKIMLFSKKQLQLEIIVVSDLSQSQRGI